MRPSLAARVATIGGADNDEFIRQTIAGNAVTVYAQNGAPVDVQLRWAKIDSTETGGAERWNLFYMSNSQATGSQPMWTNVGVDYTFGANGSLTPPIETTNLTGLVINGVDRRRRPARARRQRRHPVRRCQRHGRRSAT